ncbi:MBL fold metallo-hydrolase [Actinoplanes sp. NPDC049596]|uniref:MBL fold metallo-hydrolase n=1 Tax=unclassified Actinoplanes TaxID=2626549 RepID=UPI003417C350
MNPADADRYRRVSPVRSLELGSHRLTFIPDGSVQMDPRAWFPASTSGDWEGLGHYLDRDGFLAGSVGGLLVEHGDRAMLIDCGYGPRRLAADISHPALGVLEGGRLIDSLEQVGRAPSTIELVAFTHLHDDHVGWAIGARTEFAHAPMLATAEDWQSSAGTQLRGARRVTATENQEIFPGVTVGFAPGHTDGHLTYRIATGEQEVIAFGDVMHSPVQVGQPDWAAVFDSSPQQAAASRRRLLADLGAGDVIGFGGHFADVVFGRVVPADTGLRWEPVTA